MPIHPTTQLASQADGKTKLTMCGEVHVKLSRGDLQFSLEAVVVQELDCDILAGVPFMRENDIVLDIPKDNIIIKGKHFISYNPSRKGCVPLEVRRSQSFLLRTNSSRTLLPGEFIEVDTPSSLPNDNYIAFEPRSECTNWLNPDITTVVSGTIRIPNLSGHAVRVRKHQHLAQAYFVSTQSDLESDISARSSVTAHIKPPVIPSAPHSASVSIDPDGQLSVSQQHKFHHINQKYDQVFNKRIAKYNDASGKVRAYINMGPIEPPPQKARLPSYSTDKLRLLQSKMDDLEDMGVLAKPEDVGVTVEYVSPSFLIKKEEDYRLVTAFNMIGTYAKQSPSRSTSSEDVLRFLARFPHIIKTDMTKQFFQLPMKKTSMKYLGVLTPYKGMRVYTRAAMGMPGSTEQLDELMSRVIGDMLSNGSAVKIADDLYLGGYCVSDLLENWEKLLFKFDQNDLRLSASKTVICPITTTILGWVWSSGTITASSHKTTPLATASRPKTVKGLRSWCGAFKHLKCCIPKYTDYIHQLETITSGKESQECIHWSEELSSAFHKAQNVLKDVRTITIPRPTDHLIITNDGAITSNGVGSVLYVLRNKQMLLGGFFSAKLKSHQIKWLPCEVEALAISASVKHWAPYMVESEHPIQILTDSRPCIQAHNKLCSGQFSSSARVSTFLSTLSRYKVELQHIAGSSNLPADYHSRNPMECDNSECQVCKFVLESSDITVHSLTVSDILEGKSPMPYISRPAWKSTQQDCPSLRRTYAHLSQGTRPNRKANNIRDVKRYLRLSTLSREGIVIVKENVPFAQTRSLIVVPRHVLSGLLTALHLKLNTQQSYSYPRCSIVVSML